MIMNRKQYLVFWMCLCIFNICSAELSNVSWPSSEKNISSMILIGDGQKLIVSGLNHLYSLNTTNLQLINDVVIGPVNEIHNNVKLVIYNKTEPNNNAYITTCDTLNSYCEIRRLSDISDVVNRLESPIKSDGVQAFMTSYKKPMEWETFLFVACPHNEIQENRCSRPGINLFSNSGRNDPVTRFRFKSFAYTPILTEKYIDAFVVDKYRLFFSWQQKKSSLNRTSKIAQVCQLFKQNTYTTPFTYADMPIECGDLKELQAVKKIVFETEVVFIAVFSDSVKSSVCVYTMNEIKRTFVENIKDCYNGTRVPEEEDYFQSPTGGRPCTSPIRGGVDSTETDDYFLCNEFRLPTYNLVIGTHVLSQQPAITYNMSITAVTVSVVDSKIIAFLGTTSGDILKAVVFPRNSSSHIHQPRTKTFRDTIKKDMFTSHDEKHIFVLSERKVFKIPVESCSEFRTCDGCLGSNDPYCGWCFLEERCSTSDACPVNREWISASSGDICPHVKDISPAVMSIEEIVTLDIKVSNVLQGVNVSCKFHSDEIGPTFYTTEIARVFNDGLSVLCSPTDILDITHRIKGSLEMKVSILTNGTATTIEGTFIIYSCETFERCIDCSSRNWKCRWCPYSNQCKERHINCADISIINAEDCPRAINYTVVTKSVDIVHDSNGSVYFSRDRNYTINITGSNLLEPKTTPGALEYGCKIVVSGTQELWFNRTYFNHGSLKCYLEKESLSKITLQEGKLNATVQLMWGGSPVYGDTMPVTIYACERLPTPANNCGHCKSFALYQPHFNCQWCGVSACVDNSQMCNTTACDAPVITEVHPLSAHINATTLIQITGVNLGSSYNDTVDSVTVAGIACDSIETGYNPGRKIECKLPPSNTVMNGSVIVTRKDNARGVYSLPFQFRVPKVTAIKPSIGPMSGGTLVTLYGHLLDTGKKLNVSIGGKTCRVNDFRDGTININSSTKRVCTTTAGNVNDQDKALDVNIQFDGANAIISEDVAYTYVKDPNITSISPKESFKSGGRTLTIEGDNLHALQRPKIYAVIGNRRLKSEDCTREDDGGVIYCPSPRYTDNRNKRRKRSDSSSQEARIGFEMDDVASVKAENLPRNIAVLLYFEDPSIKNFTEDKQYTEYLSIKGERFDVAAVQSDVVIEIGCERCNVTSMAHEYIICKPPTEEPKCSHRVKSHKFIVNVNIGFLSRNVGNITYNDPSVKPLDDPGRKTEYIIAGSIVGILIFGLLISFGIVFAMMRKRKLMKKEKAGLLYKMDKIEAKFRNQCREEFAALQTAVSDLTSDLKGGNVLFREYEVYASKTLLSSQKSDILMNRESVPNQQAMDTFKGLLRNRQFLLMLIKTFEKEQSFTINDKSNVATILMILNHDNMEYVTGILTTLLDGLIDKNIASGTPKLLLRRSECVAEKLLTHWLSICLYHYLKERSGSPLYILYKAIKIQTEKGPMDYITNCGKYTLSEDKLITSADNEINPVTLTLDVTHFDYIDNTEKQISVQVLDCDTVTQAKAKMLEILYKNVPYSQRPSVHSTNLEVEEGNGGSKRFLSDEDASSTKDGIWKRINTLQHYKIQDGAKVYLLLSKELKESLTAVAAGESPGSFIVGSLRRSKPVVRTISGSNFWHLTKKHHTDDDVQLSSDLFLPRLLNTKVGGLRDVIFIIVFLNAFAIIFLCAHRCSQIYI
ncbi:plexin-A1-like [Ruditapes philippinarum]|uniref:plexin-A1-like n=1 Tax=Ruditapes philippinarum TaxID=129788 RepID=UPI00295B4EFA|nr:plexin-A1-like [Ruditapes philippinarum]